MQFESLTPLKKIKHKFMYELTFLPKWSTVRASASKPLALCFSLVLSWSFSRFFPSITCSSLPNSECWWFFWFGELTLTRSGWSLWLDRRYEEGSLREVQAEKYRKNRMKLHMYRINRLWNQNCLLILVCQMTIS